MKYSSFTLIGVILSLVGFCIFSSSSMADNGDDIGKRETLELVSMYLSEEDVNALKVAVEQDMPFVILWEHCDYAGAPYIIYGNVSYIGDRWNDRVSSIQLFNNASVTIFQHSNYEGESIFLENNNTCLVDNGFNDILSSLQLVNKVEDEYAIIYEHCGYGGRSWAIKGSYSYLGGYWNDRVSALDLRNGASAVLYRDINYAGGYINVNSDISCLVDYGFNDLASGIVVR